MNWNEIFRYEDGNLYWLDPGHGRRLNKPAGNLHPSGYTHIEFKYKRYAAHRIVFEIHNGKIPNGFEVDHIDRNRSNNKIENLRLATRQENMRNNAGVGACWKEAENSFLASIKISGKSKHLGYYDNIIDARAAYLRARREYFGEFA